MGVEVEEVLMEGPAVLEKLSGDMQYKRLVGDVVYMGYSPEEEENNHLTIYGATDFPVDMERISINKEKGTIEFSAYDGTYLVRPLSEEDSEWASEEDIEEARNGNF